MKNNKIFYRFLLAAIIIFSVVCNYAWIKQYSFFPSGPDEAVHLIQSLEFYRILKADIWNGLKNWWHTGSRAYPPLFAFSAALLNIILGAAKIASTMVNSAYLAVLIISVYFIGKRFFGQKAGLLAVFIMSCYPLVFSMQRFFLLDFALTAMVSLSLALLVYSENFTNRLFSLFFGISLGLGILTKFTFPVFVIGPVLYVLFGMIKKFKITQAINLVLSAVIGFIISLIYFGHPLKVFKYWHPGFEEAARGYIPITLLETSWRTLAGSTFYLRSLFYQISPLFVLCLLFAVVLWVRRSNKQSKVFLLLWVFMPLITLTFISNKWARYIMPVLPALSLITAGGLLHISKKKIRIFCITVCVIIGLLQYFVISFGKIEYYHPTFMYDVTRIDSSEVNLRNKIENLIAEYVLPDFDLSNRKISIGIIDAFPLMMIGDAIKYSALQKDLNCNIVCFPQNNEDFLGQEEFDVLIIVNSQIKPWPNRDDMKAVFKLEKLDKVDSMMTFEILSSYDQKINDLKETFKEIYLIKAPLLMKKYNAVYFFILNKTDNLKDIVHYIKPDTPIRTYPGVSEYKLFFDQEGFYNLDLNYRNSKRCLNIKLNQDRILDFDYVYISKPGVYVLVSDLEDKLFGVIESFEFNKTKDPGSIVHYIKPDTPIRTYPGVSEYKLFFDQEGYYNLILHLSGSNLDSIIVELDNDPVSSLYYMKIPQGHHALSFCSKEGVGLNILSFKFDKIDLLEEAKIEKEDLKLLFKDGKFRIFYKDLEITKELCLYTSLLSGGFWQDSTQAIWSLGTVSEDAIILYGKWPYLPLIQRWQINLQEGNIIDWKVEMDIKDEVEVLGQHAKLLLSDKYLKWVAEDKKNRYSGFFPNDFNRNSWRSLWDSKGKDSKVGVVSNSILPSVTFYSLNSENQYTAVLENTSRQYRGRVLGFCKSDKFGFNPGLYDYFEGRIEFLKVE